MEHDDKKPDRSQQHFANQRTFLAWLRTCIVLIGLGFVIAKFSILLEEVGVVLDKSGKYSSSVDSISISLGISVILFSVALLVYALKNYFDGYKQISALSYTPKNSIVYVSGIGAISFGVIIVVYLFLLYG